MFLARVVIAIHQSVKVRTYHLAEMQKLNYIKPPLAPLAFAHKGLRLAEASRHLFLAHASAPSGLLEEPNNSQVLFTKNGPTQLSHRW
jgi:hypothetical protein